MRLDPELLRILQTVDVDAAIKLVASRSNYLTDTRIASEAGLHKARIMAYDSGTEGITKEMRNISYTWLKANNYEIPYTGKVP